MIKTFTISRDDTVYQAWPDMALTRSGKLICVFSACDRHWPRSETRIMLCESSDRGRTWSEKRPLTDPGNLPEAIWNCPRITALRDGRLAVVVDRNPGQEDADETLLQNYMLFSEDDGRTWTSPALLPVHGIVPDKLLELDNGRWLLACQIKDAETGCLVQRLWRSDDQGASWQGPVTVGAQAGLDLCEASILQVDGPNLVAFMRENSFQGLDCYKTLSNDYGETWSDPIRFPLPGCHRPVAGFLDDGSILITYRFMQGGKGWLGAWTQNFFAALTDKESALAPERAGAATRILPIDFDRSPQADLGYSGWVQFDNGEIYIVNYIVDDAPKAQLRGYALQPSEFLIETEGNKA